jgi:hypothetical protein
MIGCGVVWGACACTVGAAGVGCGGGVSERAI